MLNCPHCGLEIEEGDASFCPHCGGPLDTITLNPPSQSGSLPSQPIHEAPTRISASSHPGESPGWSSNYGQTSGPSATPPINAAFSGPGQPVFQPLSSTPTNPPASLLPLAAPPRTKRWRLALGILALLVAFASGLGVGLLVAKPQNQQTPVASKTPLPTPIPSPTLTPIPVERVIFTDPLTTDTHPWHVGSTDCLFKNGSYHILKDISCYAPLGVQRNIAVSVQVKQVAGDATATYGISLRFTESGSFYKFLITSNSTWRFIKSVKYKFAGIVAETASDVIKPGLNAVNTLLVRVLGTHFDFFVNGIKVGQANDATYSAGLVGLTGDTSADVAFNNFQVATLT